MPGRGGYRLRPWSDGVTDGLTYPCSEMPNQSVDPPAPQEPAGAAAAPDNRHPPPGSTPLPSPAARPDVPQPDTAPPGRSDASWIFDLVTGLLGTGFCALTAAAEPYKLALSVALTAPWIIRRRYPLVALLVATAAALAQAVVLDVPLFAIVVVPMLVYSFGRWAPRRVARASLLVGLAGSAIGPLRWMVLPPSGPAGLVASLSGALVTALACAGMVSAAYAIGSRRREKIERQQQTLHEAIERQRLMLAEQEQRARAAAVDERNRIARELHDIVAHSLSVIVVQAEGGRALAAKKPEKGPEVLSTVADTSREALEEMRRMVGLLRSGSAPGSMSNGANDPYLPTPGLEDLPDLVSKTGNRVSLHRSGAPPQVSQALALTVYRIVQESLTNFLKYAGPDARADVTVTYWPDATEVTILDNGVCGGGGTGTGHGLQGMSERVSMHHGSLSAQPRSSGGFAVRAWLPLPSTSHQPYPTGGSSQP